MTSDELREHNESLKDEIIGLRDDLRTFSKDFNEHKETYEKRGNRWSAAIIILAAFLLIVILGVLDNRRNADRLEEIVQYSLCPINAFIVGGYDPGTRAPGQAQRTYDETFIKMRNGKEVLECRDALVPKRVEN
jgi:hypothetical protein